MSTKYIDIDGLKYYNEKVTAKIDAVEAKIPTANSQLTNDSLYITNQVNDLANYYTKSTTYTKGEVDTKIANLIDSAPETLNTLNELAIAIQENDSLIDTLDSAIGTKANDNTVVHLTGDENITGNKTFDSIVLPNTKSIYAKLNNGQSVPIMNISASNNMTYGAQGIGYIAFYNSIQPNSANNGIIDLGSSNSTWKDLYLTGSLKDNTNSIKISEIVKKSNLSTVATSGSYNDLLNKPTLFSGSYNDLTNKPTIPDVSSFITKDVNELTNYYNKSDIDNLVVNMSTFDGNYNNLTNKPDLSIYATLDTTELTNYTTKNALNNLLANKADKSAIPTDYAKSSDVSTLQTQMSSVVTGITITRID